MTAYQRDRDPEYNNTKKSLEAANDEVENWVCDSHVALRVQ